MAASVFARSAGILLHPTSLPGPYGIGDLGPEAYKWVDTLVSMKQTWWQILPLGPTGAGDSPYQSFSAFAGNINLLSPDLLLSEGLIAKSVIEGVGFSHEQVEFQHVAAYKQFVLREAWQGFQARRGPAELQQAFDQFIVDQLHWLPDYVLFTAIRAALGGAA
ncbi:MAG: 4-alpha-glucanotransferase, partial [Bacteroidales bacterium]|nr:4-alpha-glucanotransferase [Bacteroidales bacterium]